MLSVIVQDNLKVPHRIISLWAAVWQKMLRSSAGQSKHQEDWVRATTVLWMMAMDGNVSLVVVHFAPDSNISTID